MKNNHNNRNVPWSTFPESCHSEPTDKILHPPNQCLSFILEQGYSHCKQKKWKANRMFKKTLKNPKSFSWICRYESSFIQHWQIINVGLRNTRYERTDAQHLLASPYPQILSPFTLWGKYTSWGKISKRLLFNWAVHIILDEPTQRSEQIQRQKFEEEKTEIIQETHVFSCHCMTVRRTSQRK